MYFGGMISLFDSLILHYNEIFWNSVVNVQELIKKSGTIWKSDCFVIIHQLLHVIEPKCSQIVVVRPRWFELQLLDDIGV